MVINLCQLDLQLPVQSVPIATKSCEFESGLMARCTRYNIM
jgi:hypothetical protein